MFAPYPSTLHQPLSLHPNLLPHPHLPHLYPIHFLYLAQMLLAERTTYIHTHTYIDTSGFWRANEREWSSILDWKWYEFKNDLGKISIKDIKLISGVRGGGLSIPNYISSGEQEPRPSNLSKHSEICAWKMTHRLMLSTSPINYLVFVSDATEVKKNCLSIISNIVCSRFGKPLRNLKGKSQLKRILNFHLGIIKNWSFSKCYSGKPLHKIFPKRNNKFQKVKNIYKSERNSLGFW